MAERKVSPNQKMLKTRKRVKKSKPEFVRPESWRYLRLKKSWRKPKGLDHKMRRKIKGWPAIVSSGYKGPKAARGLHPSGYTEIIVHTPAELSKINPKFEAARIAHTVGKKKRLQIVAEARKLEVFILNFTPIEEISEIEETETEETEEIKETEEKSAAEKASKKEKKPKRRLRSGKKGSHKEKTPPSEKNAKLKVEDKKVKSEKGAEKQ